MPARPADPPGRPVTALIVVLCLALVAAFLALPPHALTPGPVYQRF